MRKELGKWLMDVAKYMTTALLLSSVFSDMNNTVIIATVIAVASLLLITGLWLVYEKPNKNK
ncbi:MAG: hypothetical protein PUK48_01165 [Spirochaetales bacterium]|nr:hypothetical protein [Spirochaetales bacterium]